jgi:hypothetical protein
VVGCQPWLRHFNSIATRIHKEPNISSKSTSPTLDSNVTRSDFFTIAPLCTRTEEGPLSHQLAVRSHSVSTSRIPYTLHSVPTLYLVLPSPPSLSLAARVSPSRSTTPVLYSRRPTGQAPYPGRVYFMPDGRHFLDSIIHSQKLQDGFFRHPVLVIAIDGDTAWF